MSWAVKYRCEFTDINGLDWKVDIEEDSFAGSITTMQAAENPLSFEYFSATDDLYDSPIKGSACDLVVYSDTDFQWLDIYNYEDRHFRVSVYYYQGADYLFWQGYVSTGEYSEPYNKASYEVVITATDLLGTLKDEPFKEDASTYYDGRQTESTIILNILGKIGVTFYNEYINVYEDSMVTDTDDSPLTQASIDVDVFRDKSCYEVLEEILKSYNAVIRQKLGIYNIYRPTELDSTVYGRVISASTVSATSFDPKQNLNRPDYASNLTDIEGGELATISPVKEILPKQDYGYKDSWISNWDLKPSSYNTATSKYDSWTYAGSYASGLDPIYNIFPGEKDGICLTRAAGGPSTNYISQSFGSLSSSTSDMIVFSFEYQLRNTSSTNSDTATWYIKIKADNANKWLYFLTGESAAWSDTEEYITLEETVPAGQGEWKTMMRSVAGLPVSGPFTITLYPCQSTYTYVSFKNLKFYCTADELMIKFRKAPKQKYEIFYWGKRPMLPYLDYVDVPEIISRDYTVSCTPTYGRRIENNYLIGDVTDVNVDNVLEQFAGALSVKYTTPSQVAAKFVSDWAAAYLPGGVTVTSDIGDILFSSTVAGVNFTGSTTITNVTGDISGNARTLQANQVAQSEIDTIALSGNSGTADISCNGVTRGATYNTSLVMTASDFIDDYQADYAAAGVTIELAGSGIRFTSVEGTAFTSGAAISNTSGNLSGTKTDNQSATVAVARIDAITISGTSGTANILCDGVTQVASFADMYSTTWNTRGGSESDPLLQIIGDELAAQTIRPKQRLRLPVIETVATPSINIMGNFQDILNSSYGIGGNLLTSPAAIDGTYDTYSETGNTYILAVNLAGNAEIRSNNLLGGVKTSDVLIMTTTYNRGSGQVPSAVLLESGVGYRSNTYEFTTASGGYNMAVFTVTNDADNVCLNIFNTDAASWEMFNLIVYRLPRKFVFNKGLFHVKQREWELNINEII